MDFLKVKGYFVFVDENNKIKEKEINETVELNVLDGNQTKFDFLNKCFFYNDCKDICEGKYKKVERIYVNGIMITPKDYCVYRDGFDFVVGDVCFELSTIYSFVIIYRTGEVALMQFTGTIDCDESSKTELEYNVVNDKPMKDYFAVEMAKYNLVRNRVEIDSNKLDKIIEIINS